MTSDVRVCADGDELSRRAAEAAVGDRNVAVPQIGSRPTAIATRSDAAGHENAIQSDRPGDEIDGDANGPALDGNGLPSNLIAIAEVRIGANVDDSEVANASETGQTTNAPRDEVRPLR